MKSRSNLFLNILIVTYFEALLFGLNRMTVNDVANTSKLCWTSSIAEECFVTFILSNVVTVIVILCMRNYCPDTPITKVNFVI